MDEQVTPDVTRPGLRVAHVMAGAPNGGAELFFERLCVAQHATGIAVLPVIRRNAARATRLRAHGLMPVELGFGPPHDLVTRLRLRAALRGFAADVAVSWMNRATRHMPAGPWIRVGRLGGYYPPRHYRDCDYLVGNTRGIVSWLRGRGFAAARTHYLPNFAADFATTPAAADLVDLPRPLLLGLGRLHTDKGFDTLLQALTRVPRAGLAIAGEGPELKSLERLTRELGLSARVRFLGWRQDSGALLRAADVFVCASRIEPLGNMIIEAWSAGTPVVALKAAGPAELIVDGKEGLLSPLESPALLAESINALLVDAPLGAALAAAGRRRYEAEFAATPVLAAWHDFLDGVRAGRLTTGRARASSPSG